MLKAIYQKGYAVKPKYKLIKERYRNSPVTTMDLFRIKAVAGVPERGIKRGTKGGLVSGPEVLSQLGNCWISEDAVVIRGTVSENAVILGTSMVVRSHVAGNAQVKENAKVGPNALVQDQAVISGNARVSGIVGEESTVTENSILTDYVVVSCSHISGDSYIGGRANIEKSQTNGKTRITHGATVKTSTISKSEVADSAEVLGSIISGSTVNGHAIVEDTSLLDSSVIDGGRVSKSEVERTTVEHRAVIQNSKIQDSHISGAEVIDDDTASGLAVGLEGWEEFLTKGREEFQQARVRGILNSRVATIPAIAPPKKSIHLRTLESIEEKYEEYTTDIINILTYPVMTDMTDENTRNLVKYLRRARRYAEEKDEEKLAEAVDELEDAFLVAESNARKIKDSNLVSEHQKKLKDAHQMFALAFDSGATEHEKEASFKAGMGNLKGIIDVPEKAIIALRGRIGLKELTA